MSERETFGPDLRRMRVQRNVSLDEIAAATKVNVDLWAGLERNDFSRWPTGIYARSYVRAYAEAVGADPESTVNEFCRWFPNGDRRAERIVREQAAIVGHDLQWRNELVAGVARDRRSPTRTIQDEIPLLAYTKTGRVIAAATDLAAVVGVTAALRSVLPFGWGASIAIGAIGYHTGALVALGCTPSVWVIDTYLASRHPTPHREGPRFLRLLKRPVKVRVQDLTSS
jgi:hypothetical protein